MNHGAAFEIGKTHAVCEDYAVSDVSDDGNLAVSILSDGCSTEEDTDLGCRIVSRLALRALLDDPHQKTWELFERINPVCIQSAMMLGASDRSLSATMLACVVDDESIRFICAGDGVFGVAREDITWAWDVVYEDSKPFYPIFDTIGVRVKDPVVNSIMMFNGEAVTGDAGELADSGLVSTYMSKNRALFAFMFSDGIHSFREGNRKIPASEVMSDFFSFKSFNGDFLRRRINFFKKSCNDKGWVHDDDFSVSIIVI